MVFHDRTRGELAWAGTAAFIQIGSARAKDGSRPSARPAGLRRRVQQPLRDRHDGRRRGGRRRIRREAVQPQRQEPLLEFLEQSGGWLFRVPVCREIWTSFRVTRAIPKGKRDSPFAPLFAARWTIRRRVGVAGLRPSARFDVDDVRATCGRFYFIHSGEPDADGCSSPACSARLFQIVTQLWRHSWRGWWWRWTASWWGRAGR